MTTPVDNLPGWRSMNERTRQKQWDRLKPGLAAATAVGLPASVGLGLMAWRGRRKPAVHIPSYQTEELLASAKRVGDALQGVSDEASRLGDFKLQENRRKLDDLWRQLKEYGYSDPEIERLSRGEQVPLPTVTSRRMEMRANTLPGGGKSTPKKKGHLSVVKAAERLRR